MTKIHWATAILVAPLLLSGCNHASRASLGMTENVQTTKSPDYSGSPHKIAAVVQAETLDPRFNDALVDSASHCGVQLVLKAFSPGQPVDPDDADAVLTIQELGHQMSRLAHPGLLNRDPWLSMVRLQFSLIDIKSKKQVWNGQADFNVGDFMGNFHESNPTQRWADDLAGLMLKDKIFPACNFNRKRA